MTTISSGISGTSNWGGMQPPRMEGRGGGKPSFSSIDTDGSGGLDKTELQAMIDKGPRGAQATQATQATQGSSTDSAVSTNGVSTDDLFSKLDTDGDGSISQTELDKGMKPPGQDGNGQNAFGGMGMDTQGFAAMMGSGMGGMMGGMPPPPPPGDGGGFSLSQLDSDQDGSITKAEFGLSDSSSSSSTSSSNTSSSSSTSSTDDTQQALFDMIDSDQSGDISKAEASSFQDKMKALFETMQQMGAQQLQSSTSSLSVTA